MINQLWTGISLENYNKWYPLTGTITKTPQQYINTWPNANNWFTTFALRAQNDINAYLDFILYKFPFDSFKDKLIQETLSDMVYVMIEHWVFNRTPIEFNVDATIQFNNGTQFSANSIPTINVWDLAPSRMKILAQLTQLKQIFSSYDEQEINADKIDLGVFYTRNQVDELIKQQEKFTLAKQIKLYDDVVTDNEHELYRGPVTKFINKSYAATTYDQETETMILDWPSEIGTLPPEALQPNPQIGDFTHAATADFSAKQKKRITTNENNIKSTNARIDINKQNIDDIKNNYFNIETSPLWEKYSNPIVDDDRDKWFVVKWSYLYQNVDKQYDYYSLEKITKFQLGTVIQWSEPNNIILDKLILNNNVNITLLFSVKGFKIYITSDNENYKVYIDGIFKYKGSGTPTEFIATNTNNNYYTKPETDSLLDKKQDKTDNNLKTDSKEVVKAINGNFDLLVEHKSNITKNTNNINVLNNKLELKQNKLTAGTNITISTDNTISATGNISGFIVPKNDKILSFNPITKELNSQKILSTNFFNNKEFIKGDWGLSLNYGYIFRTHDFSPNIYTIDKTIIGAINELKNKIQSLEEKIGKEIKQNEN